MISGIRERKQLDSMSWPMSLRVYGTRDVVACGSLGKLLDDVECRVCLPGLTRLSTSDTTMLVSPLKGKEHSHSTTSTTMLTGPYRARQRTPFSRITSTRRAGNTLLVVRRGVPSAWRCSTRSLLHTLHASARGIFGFPY